MERRCRAPIFTMGALGLMLSGVGAEAQVDQRTIAAQLLKGSVEQRSQAVEAARSLKPQDIDIELRTALATTLAQEARAHAQQYEAGRRGEQVPEIADPELIGRVARVVAELRDARTIPALSEALGSGFTVIRALAAFGQQAAPSVLSVVTSPMSTHYAVSDGLVTLRFMVEQANVRPLTKDTLDQIRTAAEQRLREKPLFIGTTWWAIDLAVALDDPVLRQIVSTIASDPGEARARGALAPDVIAQTQKRATDRLAGIPALPRP